MSAKVFPWIVATFFGVILNMELSELLSFSVHDFAKQASLYNTSVNPTAGAGENWNPSDTNGQNTW